MKSDEINEILKWSNNYGLLYEKVEENTSFDLQKEKGYTFYCAHAKLDGLNYDIRYTLGKIEIDCSAIERIQHILMRAILIKWAEDKNIDLSPPKASSQSVRQHPYKV